MFENRGKAGELLALKLRKIVNPSAGSGQGDFIIVPLLRGGIVLGKKISDYFSLPLKPLAVKKIGAPLNPELGIGAVSFDKTYYFDCNLVKELDVSENYKQVALETKYQEAKLLQEKIEQNTGKISCRGKSAIVVDDGVAIGNTVICASLYLRKQAVKKIILAIPVISKDGINGIKKYFDRVVALKIPENLFAVGEFYKEFPQVLDEEVIKLLS